MKNLILCPGLPRSGTTTLWKLLSLDDSVIKESQYLFAMYNFDSSYPKLYPEDAVRMHKQFIIEMHKYDLNFPSPYSFEDYSQYINDVPFDFSQTNWLLSEQYLKEIKESLPQFNIKIILMYREPIERLYSYCNMICSNWNSGISAKELFLEYVKACDTLYVDVYNKFKNVFDDVICLSTEKFFNNQEDYDRLPDFLNMPSIKADSTYENKREYPPLSQDEIDSAKKLIPSSYEFYVKI